MYGIGIFCIVLSGFINLFDRKGKKNGATRAKAFDGPGHIILQSMPIASTALKLYEYMPHSSNN